MEERDLGYAEQMVEHTRRAISDIQYYLDSYHAGDMTLKEINKETGVKRSERELDQELQEAQQNYDKAVKTSWGTSERNRQRYSTILNKTTNINLRHNHITSTQPIQIPLPGPIQRR